MNQSSSHKVPSFLYTVYFIYFFCGMAMCFEGVFLPEFKEHFHLSYQEQMYIMFTKNIPFVIFSLLAGYLTKRIGFKKCLSLAIFLFGIGTYLLIPGLETSNYWIILMAFFIIGTGFNFELVSGNPLLSKLGNQTGSSSRLNMGNALGAIAQIISPLLLTFIIPLSVVNVADKLPYIKLIFLIIAILLILLSIFVFFFKNKDSAVDYTETEDIGLPAEGTVNIWKNPRVILGLVAIFFVLGIESALFGLYRNFLEDPNIGGLSAHESQKMFTIYFALFALGRVVAWALQKKISPALNLSVNLIMALILFFIAIFSKGSVAIWSLTALSFFISIFFPTIYSLSIQGLGGQTGKASGLLIMGMLGAAILPVVQGKIADVNGLQNSFFIVFVPYLFTLYFALRGHKLKSFIKDDKHQITHMQHQ